MSRISGVEMQDNWRVVYGLTRIKGIGFSLSKKIAASLKIEDSKRISELTSDELAKLTTKVDEFPNEGDLVRQVKSNITRLQRIGSYRGLRHNRGLPTRGQRTRRNARTKRGKRKTVGAFKKDLLAKVAKVSEEKKA